MPSHSTVVYVEPNMTNHSWQKEDNFERTPRLEDYCIAMNIEVEVSSRDCQGSIKDGDKDVIILQWNNGESEKVNFMGGTKIGGYNYDGAKITPRVDGTSQNLTTYYADMYVGDLVNYGTSEMIGIKSVNVEYAKSCVPIITVQFTDVRGLSLFQPTELSRDNTYNGIKGLSKDNVAQSFFQCFFKMPLPKFTIYIKGFYGNPVSYVCMCDKFDTNFNSDTGDFDVTARFIGYSYSFLTDISFDALLAAPYSDFFGKKYWEDNKAERFRIWDKLKTHKMPMPTLYEVHREFKRLIQTSNSEMEETTLTEEEKTHEQEIAKLKEIRGKYQIWYETLFNLLKIKYGKRYCFDFKENISKDGDWYRILVLTNSKTQNEANLSKQYTQYSNDFKKINDDLYAAIENFNKSGNSFKTLKNVSKDFSAYTRIKLFNDCYVDKNTRKIEFGGFSRENTLNRVEVTNRLFHSSVATNEIEGDSKSLAINSDWTSKHGKTIKDFTLSTIYNDGIDQYKDAFLIEVDYSGLKRRINALIAHSKKSDEEKEIEKRRKEHNRIMLGKMNWYPSIENFTKIMMAHLETFMMMMYNVAESCSDRKPEDLGVTIGKNGDCCDVNDSSDIVPPFPRVIKKEIGEDGITKSVDTWIGSYEGEKSFIEADMINGLFNAVEYIQELVKEEKEAEEVNSSEPQVPTIPIKHPLTSYDFHLNVSPYGSESDVVNDLNAFAGKISMRMFNILSINNFRKQYTSKFDKSSADFIKKLGSIEADNFYDHVKITNGTFLKMLGTSGDNGTITPYAILQCVKHGIGIGGNNEIPWYTSNNDEDLFDSSLWLKRWTTSYSPSFKTKIYPMQDMSFGAMDETLKIFNKDANTVQANNNNIIVDKIEPTANIKTLLESSNSSCFGSVFISDDYKVVANYLDKANSSFDNIYKDIYDLLHDDSVFNSERFKDMIYAKGVFRPKMEIVTEGKSCNLKLKSGADSLSMFVDNETNVLKCDNGKPIIYSFDIAKLDAYTSEIENGNITSWFLTESRGYSKNRDMFVPSEDKSLLLQEEYRETIDKLTWGYGTDCDKRLGFFLMGLDAIDYTHVTAHLDSNETFTYLPRLAVLQIGAALTSMNDIKDVVSIETLSRNIVLPRSFDKIVGYLNKINYTTRIAYIKYFKEWVSKNINEYDNNLFNTDNEIACFYRIGENRRGLFREDSSFISLISNELMNAVLVTKGNVNHYMKVSKQGLEIDDYVASTYLDGFLSRLRELYGTSKENSGGDSVKQVKSSSKTTEDMKKELYRYLKLVYDKWIPSTDKESWKFETFFNDYEESKIRGKKGCDGHLFHFIDSFYNKIGDKLLINPKLLSDKIDAVLQTNDVNTMMLGFMADIYNQNKCMMMCLQNFMDLSEKSSMEVMFKPIPYNEMPTPHKHPDFVIVYPYEPSKYLNVDNGEFNNDSFMLNDEFDTPLPIRSRGANEDGYYQIPAFGVSYGKQYQSYFKKVSVGMANPIATQQAIMAKHAILRASQDSSTMTTMAQDLYDIYATQSYTCKVEMLGCAWIQPLMYFVLTNVPMFRGSYLIFKVTHKITPGNMITEFSGTRMANVSNKLVEDIFTDEEFDASETPYIEYKKEEEHEVDSDCACKTFPIHDETDEVSIDAESKASGVDLIRSLISLGYSEYAAAGIVGNMFAESGLEYDKVVKDGADDTTSGGLCMWHNGNLIDCVEKKDRNLGHNKTKLPYSEEIRKEYSEKLRKNGVGEQLKFLKNTMTKGNGNYVPLSFESYSGMSTSPSTAALSFMKHYERPAEWAVDREKERMGSEKTSGNTRAGFADKFYKEYKGTSSKVEKTQPSKDVTYDIYKSFFEAVKKSINETSNACQLNRQMLKEKTKNDEGLMAITQNGGKNDKLQYVFDIILNGYYKYVQKLWWVYPENGLRGYPIQINVVVSQNPKPNERRVLVVQYKYEDNIRTLDEKSEINEFLLKTLQKKYKTIPNNEIPQFRNKELFETSEMQDCGTSSKDSKPVTVEEVKTHPNEGMIGNWNVQKAVDWLLTYSRDSWKDKICKPGAPIIDGSCVNRCWGYVKRALGHSGFKTDGSSSAYMAKDYLAKNGFKCIYKGEVRGHNGSDYADKHVGDITVFDVCSGHEYGHIDMWCGRQWVSDFKQDGNWISQNATTNFTVWRYTGSGGNFKS